MRTNTETPAPQLLSPERLLEIMNRHAKADNVTAGEVVQMPDSIPRYSVVCTDLGFATCKTWAASNAFFYLHAHQDIPDLLADRAAFRQQVAEQLSRLLYLPQLIAEMEPNAARSARYQNLLTRTAATRLGLELPA